MYLERLTWALGELGGIDLIEVHSRRRRPPAGGGMASAGNALVDQWWTQRELPRLARSCAADLIHHPLPARAQWSAVPQVVTVRDLAPHGPGQLLPPPPRPGLGQLPTPPASASHFLYVGDDEPRKNLATLLEGYRRYRAGNPNPIELVPAGDAFANAHGVRSVHRTAPSGPAVRPGARAGAPGAV